VAVRAKHEPVLMSFLDDAKHLPSVETAAWIGSFGALSAVSHPLDRSTNQRLQTGLAMGDFFSPGAALGDNTSLLIAGAGAYAWGRWKGETTVAHAGSDLFRGELESEFVTEVLKVAVGRPRPDGSGSSFPSGHAATAFTAATVLARHFGPKVGIP